MVRVSGEDREEEEEKEVRLGLSYEGRKRRKEERLGWACCE